MKVRELSFPAKTGMSFFQEILSNRALLDIIRHFSHLSKKERTIEMPSAHHLKKAICHFYGRRVLNKEMTFQEVVRVFKKNLTFKEIGIEPREIKRLFWQREREILRENK